MHRTVQTVRHAQEHPSGLPVTLGDESLIRLSETLIPSLVTLHYLPYLFINHQQMVVLIQDA